MRVFVTGGTGFIGAHVVKKLESEGDTLLLLSRGSKATYSLLNIPKTVNIISGDLSDINSWKEKVERFQPQATIHMAWEGLPDYGYKTSIRNLKYGLDFVTMLAELGCKRVITTGSCWEYGRKYEKLSEDITPISNNAFTAAKNALHWMGREIAKENNMQFIWTRLFYVYGPGQREASLIPYIIKCVSEGKKPEIKTLSARNDFIYVEDVAEAISMLVKNCKQSGVYNIGSGYSTSIQQIIEVIYDEFYLQYNVASTPQNDSIVDFWADISRIKRDTGWKPKIGIQEGIKKIINHYHEITSIKKEVQ
jgi:nucleoside-diphosphate-sugar epimerase